ncbi:MAG: ABC transporter permease, partial [Conexibacter sp.]
MRLGALLYLYGRRVRTHPIQELLAGMGIAIGVALVLAVVVANESFGGSVSQLMRGLGGDAKLQLVARDPHGLDGRLAGAVRALPDVAHAAPLFEQRARLRTAHGQASVLLLGIDPSLTTLDGALTHGVSPATDVAFRDGLLLPSGAAAALGVQRWPLSALVERTSRRSVQVRLHGRLARAPVAAVLGPELIGSLSQSAVAHPRRRQAPTHTGAPRRVDPHQNAAPPPPRLGQAQTLAGAPGRVDRILVAPRPGRSAAARQELRALARGRAAVLPIDADARVLAQATGPADESAGLFAAISAIVGLLLAFTAMLLTVPERRRSIADLRLQGFAPRQVALVLGFQSLVLGVAASAVGVALGELLARTRFDAAPTVLTFAF